MVNEMEDRILIQVDRSSKKFEKPKRDDIVYLLSNSGRENCLAKYIKTKEQADRFMAQLEALKKQDPKSR